MFQATWMTLKLKASPYLYTFWTNDAGIGVCHMIWRGLIEQSPLFTVPKHILYIWVLGVAPVNSCIGRWCIQSGVP